jgi:hypothetical protein
VKRSDLIFLAVIWGTIICLYVVIHNYCAYHPVQQSSICIPSSPKCGNLNNPDRPFFDACGNEFDYTGKLMNRSGVEGCDLQPESSINGGSDNTTIQPWEGK